MPWTLTHWPDLAVIETVYSGRIGASELRSAVESTISAFRSTGALRVLSDCTRLEGGHSIVDLYALVDLLGSLALPASFREAILLPQQPFAAEDVRAWETFCVNRGILVRVFQDRQAALDWLVGPA
jgi:hypothetical protein